MAEQMPGECGSCKWAQFEMTKHDPPRINTQFAGRCFWPEPPQVLALSITTAYGYQAEHYRNAINASMRGCPTWEPGHADLKVRAAVLEAAAREAEEAEVGL